MEMSEYEICREYKQAKDKRVQVGILADLNLCSRKRILLILNQNGLCAPPRRKNAPKIDKQLAAQMVIRGMSNKQIANVFGCKPAAVGSFRRRNDMYKLIGGQNAIYGNLQVTENVARRWDTI